MNPKAAARRPKRAVGYVRISQDRDDETSTSTQEEHIRSYCAMHKWDLVDVIVEPGRSGFKASRSSRPGYRRVKQMVEAGAVDVVVVWKLNRVVRNTIDVAALTT